MLFAGLLGAGRASCVDAFKVCVNLYRVMLPLLILVRLLSEFDLIRYVAMPLEPLMSLMGLPADLGIVWAAGMVVNLYSALILFASILPTLDPLSVAQVSVLWLVVLYAHSLPVECRIAQQCGTSFLGQVLLRIGVAIVSGVVLHQILNSTGWLSGPAVILFKGGNAHPPLLQWIWDETVNCAMIYVIIVLLLLMQQAINHFNLTRWIEYLFRPLLRAIDVSDKAASTIMIGMILGLIYGSGLIIKAAQDGTLNRKDIFGSITLIGLAHAIIEDTLLMLVAGADWFVVLIIRPLFAIAIGAVVMRVRQRYAPFGTVA